MRKSAATLILPLALACCGPGENDPGPGGVTVGEAKALDDAAEMLDKQTAMENPAADPGQEVSEAPAMQ